MRASRRPLSPIIKAFLGGTGLRQNDRPFYPCELGTLSRWHIFMIGCGCETRDMNSRRSAAAPRDHSSDWRGSDNPLRLLTTSVPSRWTCLVFLASRPCHLPPTERPNQQEPVRRVVPFLSPRANRPESVAAKGDNAVALSWRHC